MTRKHLRKIDVKGLKGALARYVYVVGADRVADRLTGALLTRQAFSAMATDIAPAGAGGERSAFAVWINAGAERVDAMTYAPGQEQIFKEGEGAAARSYFNTWTPGMLEPPFDATEKDIAPWLDHVGYILPDPVARELFLNWCAFLIQNPGQKINWAYLLIGEQGVGKDIMLRPIQGILGRDNYQGITAESLTGAWQDWAENQLVILEELPSFHKRDVYDWLKRFTAEGVPYFAVNKKNLPIYNVRNIQNWFIMSNHSDALALEAGDRRYFVYQTPATQREPDYYKNLVATLHDRAFQSLVMSWLLQRDLSAFDPGARPPLTAAKERMIEETRNPFHAWLRDMFDEGGRFEGRRLITVAEIADHGRGQIATLRAAMKLKDRVGDERQIGLALGVALRDMRAKRLDRRIRLRPGEQAAYLWALRTPEPFEQMLHEGRLDDLKALYLNDIREAAKRAIDAGGGGAVADESRS